MQVDKTILADNAGWTFAGISEDFEDHVAKSVPLYHQGHDLVCKYSDFFVSDDSLVAEIGCSTGALSRKFLEWHKTRKGLRFLGIDPVDDMIKFAARSCEDTRAKFVCEDALASDMNGADLIISYYTVQFVRPRVRQELIDRIYESLNWGGAFMMFEKVRAPDARFQDFASQIYTDYKIDAQFTSENIVHKTRSLKGVLEPFSTQGNIDLLTRSGFKDISTIQKWVCFEGFLAIK